MDPSTNCLVGRAYRLLRAHQTTLAVRHLERARDLDAWLPGLREIYDIVANEGPLATDRPVDVVVIEGRRRNCAWLGAAHLDDVWTFGKSRGGWEVLGRFKRARGVLAIALETPAERYVWLATFGTATPVPEILRCSARWWARILVRLGGATMTGGKVPNQHVIDDLVRTGMVKLVRFRSEDGDTWTDA